MDIVHIYVYKVEIFYPTARHDTARLYYAHTGTPTINDHPSLRTHRHNAINDITTKTKST